MKNGLILVNYLVGNNSCSRMKYGIPVLFRQTYFLQRIFRSVNWYTHDSLVGLYVLGSTDGTILRQGLSRWRCVLKPIMYELL